MNNRFLSAKKNATNIVSELKLMPPIEPISIIELYGIKIVEEENQYGIEAYSNLGSELQITISTEFAFPARRNFTLAHELGHIMIPWHNGDVKCDTDKPYYLLGGKRFLDTQELEANIFASELLMPECWLKTIIPKGNINLEALINKIKDTAQTSIMACMYALEDTLPSGHLCSVKKDFADYWKKFKAARTATTSLFYDLDKNLAFLDKICEYKNLFHISQYDVIHYCLRPCPNSNTISEIYNNVEKDIVELINVLSEYEPLYMLHSIDYILNSINNVYTVIICENNEVVRKVSSEKAVFKFYSSEYSELLAMLQNSRLEYQVIDIKPFHILFVKEMTFYIQDVRKADPNMLLRNIVNDIYYDTPLRMLQRINGVVSSANSSNKASTSEQLFNIIKYRFLCDSDYKEFRDHRDFDTYLINKVNNMITNRK